MIMETGFSSIKKLPFSRKFFDVTPIEVYSFLRLHLNGLKKSGANKSLSGLSIN